MSYWQKEMSHHSESALRSCYFDYHFSAKYSQGVKIFLFVPRLFGWVRKFVWLAFDVSNVFIFIFLRLSTQYRMHPMISKFPSSFFYRDEISDHESVNEVGKIQPYTVLDIKVSLTSLQFHSSLIILSL